MLEFILFSNSDFRRNPLIVHQEPRYGLINLNIEVAHIADWFYSKIGETIRQILQDFKLLSFLVKCEI